MSAVTALITSSLSHHHDDSFTIYKNKRFRCGVTWFSRATEKYRGGEGGAPQGHATAVFSEILRINA